MGQLLIAIDPSPPSGDAFALRLEILSEAILEQENTRLPGARRLGLRHKARKDGVLIKDQLFQQLTALGGIS